MDRITQLQEELQTARATLVQTLTDGRDTEAIRADIAEIEAELQAEQEKASQQAAAAASEARRAAREAGGQLADAVHADIEQTVSSPALVELAGDLPPLPRVAEIDFAAQAVARAEAALAVASSAVAPHVAKVRDLQMKVDGKRREISELHSRRQAGETRSRDAAELELLRADLELLEKLAGEARAQLAAVDNRDECRADLQRANADLQRQKDQATFTAAKARVQQAEQAFMAAWQAMCVAGRSIGKHSPWSEWQASPDMRRAVTGAMVAGARLNL